MGIDFTGLESRDVRVEELADEWLSRLYLLSVWMRSCLFTTSLGLIRTVMLGGRGVGDGVEREAPTVESMRYTR